MRRRLPGEAVTPGEPLTPGSAAPRPPGEWREGWRIVLACSLASSCGVVLLFFSFSLFLLPIMAELKLTRGEFGLIQAMVIAGAISSPLIGRLTDRYGFRPAFLLSTAIVIAVEIAMACWADSMASMALCVFLLGFFGVGTTALTTTRPVSAHFRQHRGKALGLVVAGVSLATILAPTPLQAIMADHGWRGAVLALAALSALVSVPAVLLILPRQIGRAPARAAAALPTGAAIAFLRDGSFWVLALTVILIGAATSGFVAQLSPMVQEEGLSAATGALALSAFAVGQLTGRLGGGVLLDRFEPRRVAVLATLLPGSGFALFLLAQGSVPLALLAAGLIGLLAGAEQDIGAFFIARLYPIAQYSTIYGSLHALGWIGNAAGIIGIGQLHDRTGSYALAQMLALVLLALGAALFPLVRLPSRQAD